MSQKTKLTKLPIPKTLAEKYKEQRNQTPSPTGIPKPSSSTLSPGGSGAQSTGREMERDHYWKRLRDKFEKDSSPLSQRTSYVRSRESDRSAVSDLSRDDQPITRGAKKQTVIPTPSTAKNALQDSRPRQTDDQSQWTLQEGHWAGHETNDCTPHKSNQTDTTADSSPRSHPSVSPVSAEADSSMTEWEDRFVVHMPTAKDPNPPTMTAQQIADYQRSIEMVHRDGGYLVDPNTRPSPRNGSPETRSSPASQGDRVSGGSANFKAYDGRPMQSPAEIERQIDPSPPAPQTQGKTGLQAQPHYYSPDEIGKNRISTIWEEQSPTKTKDKRHSANADGSFLGCKEINGPGTKNPDEILLFGSGEESANIRPRPLAVARKPKEEKTSALRALRRPGDTRAVQEEWSEVSRNSKNAQCLKQPMTLCQEQECSDNAMPRSDSQGSSKENYHPTESESSSPEKHDDGRSEDDVFIITPTITRTMIPTPTPEKQAKKEERKVSGPKPSGLRRPGGIGQSVACEAVKAVRAKAQVISTPSGLRPAAGMSHNKSTAPSLTSSRTVPLSSIPTAKDIQSAKENPKETDATTKDTPLKKDKSVNDKSSQAAQSIRGFIRTSGLARSTGLVRSPTDSIASILRSGTESLRNRAESLRNGNGSIGSRKGSPVSQPSGPSRDNSESSRSERSFKSAREKATPPPTTKSSPVKKESPAAKPVLVEKPSVPQKSPPAEKSAPIENSKPSEKPERLSRAERLEKFREQARLRRASKVVEIAELDGQQVQKKAHLQSNITDVYSDLSDLETHDKDTPSRDPMNGVALSMIFEIIVMAVTHVHKFALQMTDSPYTKFLVTNVLNMTRHCFRVFSRVYRAVSRYQATGTWPKAKNDQAISRFLVELLQATVYMFILGFGVMVVGRTASYIVLIGSWIVWFARPFAWMFQCFGRALIH